MKKVLGIGNALVDIIIFLRNNELLTGFNLPVGSMQLVDLEKSKQVEQAAAGLNRHMASGGSAANTIHGLARLGIETAFIGSVGNDSYGSFFREDLIKSCIKPLLVEDRLDTGRALSLVSPDGERTFATYLGAAVLLNADHISEKVFKGYDHMHLEGYLVINRELTETALEAARATDMTISLDLASYNIVESNIGFLKDILSRYNPVVFANEDEARAFTGCADPNEALEKLSEYCSTVVVKTGEKGSLIAHSGERSAVGVIDVNCIDTTGAGDLYAAGFLYGLINGLTIRKCGEMGALLAGKVIETPGAKITEQAWRVILEKVAAA